MKFYHNPGIPDEVSRGFADGIIRDMVLNYARDRIVYWSKDKLTEENITSFIESLFGLFAGFTPHPEYVIYRLNTEFILKPKRRKRNTKLVLANECIESHMRNSIKTWKQEDIHRDKVMNYVYAVCESFRSEMRHFNFDYEEMRSLQKKMVKEFCNEKI